MKRLMLSVAAMVAASIVVVNAGKQGHKGHTSSNQLSGSVHVVFSTDDVRVNSGVLRAALSRVATRSPEEVRAYWPAPAWMAEEAAAA